jgi:hypothetical protein
MTLEAADKVEVFGNVENAGTREYVHIVMSYGPQVLASQPMSKKLSSLVVEKYLELSGDPPSAASQVCILEIRATVAGSRVVKAVYDVFSAVRARGGTLFCVGYPNKYITALATLGLLGLQGFALEDGIESALARAFPNPVNVEG